MGKMKTRLKLKSQPFRSSLGLGRCAEGEKRVGRQRVGYLKRERKKNFDLKYKAPLCTRWSLPKRVCPLGADSTVYLEERKKGGVSDPTSPFAFAYLLLPLHFGTTRCCKGGCCEYGKKKRGVFGIL